MNKLKTNVLTKHQWGTEIMWSLTDNYIAKTVEIPPNNCTPLLTHWKKEISLIVVKGSLRLTCGPFNKPQDHAAYDLPEGWSWYIEAGTSYRYEALKDAVTIIEVSTPQLDDILIPEPQVKPKEKTTKRKRKSKKDGEL